MSVPLTETFRPGDRVLVPVRDVTRLGIEEAPRRPRYWAEGFHVVSCLKRRYSLEQARDVLMDRIATAMSEPDDDFMPGHIAAVEDLIRAIRSANAFTPPTPANAVKPGSFFDMACDIAGAPFTKDAA